MLQTIAESHEILPPISPAAEKLRNLERNYTYGKNAAASQKTQTPHSSKKWPGDETTPFVANCSLASKQTKTAA